MNMQNIALKKILREEIIRAFVFVISLSVFLGAGFAGVVYAADGGKF